MNALTAYALGVCTTPIVCLFGLWLIVRHDRAHTRRQLRRAQDDAERATVDALFDRLDAEDRHRAA